jgi:hypothetical protein
METISSRFDTVAHVLPSAVQIHASAFEQRLAALYALSQKSNYIFASPLGPFFQQGRHFHLPRFVYFGPQTHDESVRLAFLSGFDSRNLAVSFAVTDLIEGLAASPEIGQGLNLSFFPLIDVLNPADTNRELWLANWALSHAPEIAGLEKDARARGYHGFVRIDASAEDDLVVVRLRDGKSSFEQVDLATSEDFEPWATRWEAEEIAGHAVKDGPLTLVDDLPVRPFELTIQLPRKWHDGLQRDAAAKILRRVISRQRTLQAYRQHL